MLKLLHAGLFRLRRSRLLWLCAAAAFAVSSAFLLQIGGGESVWTLDEALFQVFPFLPVLYAAFVGLFLGMEYQDGTLRSKLIAGHTRGAVYLSALFTAMLGCLGIALGWALSAAVGTARLGWFSAPWTALLLRAALAALTAAASASILTLLAVLIPNRAVSAVAAILTAFALLALGSYFYNALCEPEMLSAAVMTESGFEIGEPTPNPNYIRGTLRTVYQLLMEALPSGQAILLANGELTRPLLSLGASACIVLLTSGAGIAAFRRKDLK